MKHERIGPAREGEAGNVHATERPGHSRISPKKPAPKSTPPLPDPSAGVSVAEWAASLVPHYFEHVEVVDGELGPIALIGSPRVCVGFRADCTLVWVERCPFEWTDPFREYLKPRSGSACRYALHLASKLRDMANAEFARRERIKEAKVRERLSFLNRERGA